MSDSAHRITDARPPPSTGSDQRQRLRQRHRQSAPAGEGEHVSQTARPPHPGAHVVHSGEHQRAWSDAAGRSPSACVSHRPAGDAGKSCPRRQYVPQLLLPETPVRITLLLPETPVRTVVTETLVCTTLSVRTTVLPEMPVRTTVTNYRTRRYVQSCQRRRYVPQLLLPQTPLRTVVQSHCLRRRCVPQYCQRRR